MTGIVGVGLDLVEVERIRRLIERHGERVLGRVFTEAERAYCDASRRRFEHYAARFAAKEAAFKALGTGRSGEIRWTDAGIVRAASGAPSLVVAGEAQRLAAARGVTAWQVSLTHTEAHAAAAVVALG